MVVGWNISCELMANTEPQVVLTKLLSPFALASISLKVLMVAVAAVGLRAASLTDISPLFGSLSKSIAPLIPAVPDRKPESPASSP